LARLVVLQERQVLLLEMIVEASEETDDGDLGDDPGRYLDGSPV